MARTGDGEIVEEELPWETSGRRGGKETQGTAR